MVFSFAPFERQYKIYEPVFHQKVNIEVHTFSFLILNDVSEIIFKNSYSFIKIAVINSVSLFAETKSFSLKEILFISSFLRNIYYTFTSIHAP